MEKVKQLFSSPKKIAAVVVIAVLLIGCAVFAASHVNATGGQGRGIGMDKSIAVALHDAGFKEDEVTDLHAAFDHDDGVDAYDVFFIANGYQYEYEIKAADGQILDCSVERPDGTTADPQDLKDIGIDKAKEAALAHAGFKASDVNFTKTKLDYDDGQQVYEIEFVKGNTEYDYDINAADGAVIKFSKEQIKSNANSGNGPSQTTTPSGNGNNSSSSQSSNYIGVDKAKSIALKDAGVSASAATFTKAKLDRDDGRVRYEIEFFAGDMEYEYEIDPVSGKILDKDSEYNDDFDDDDDWDDHHDDDHDDHDDHDWDD